MELKEVLKLLVWKKSLDFVPLEKKGMQSSMLDERNSDIWLTI